MAMPFDTLKLARRLEAAGFPPQQAGDMAEAIAEALADLATKSDIAALKADIAALKADIAALEARIDTKLEILKRDMTIRLGSMMVIAVGVILAGFKLIH
jgi:ubiquinone biosynthesis protein UbiJ